MEALHAQRMLTLLQLQVLVAIFICIYMVPILIYKGCLSLVESDRWRVDMERDKLPEVRDHGERVERKRRG